MTMKNGYSNDYHASWLRRWRKTRKGKQSNKFAQTLYKFQSLGDAEMVEALLQAEKELPRWEIDLNAIKRRLKRGCFKDPKFGIEQSVKLKRRIQKTTGIPAVFSPDEIAYVEREQSYSRHAYWRNRKKQLRYAKGWRKTADGKAFKRFGNTLAYARKYNPTLERILIAEWRKLGRQKLVDIDACKEKAGMIRNKWTGKWKQQRKAI
jgi:hypothetical protein